MPLHPYLSDKLSLLDGLEFPDLADPAKMACFIEFYTDHFPWTLPEDVAAQDVLLPSEEGEVPVRMYRPAATPKAGLLWLHGGGFVGGDLDMPEAHVVAAEIAQRGSVLVASVDYRLAGNGVTYPAPVDDAITAWQALVQELEPGTPIALGGASAGAAIAMSAALRAGAESERAADALLLAYPFVHYPTPTIDAELANEMKEFPPLVRFTPESIAGMVEGYVGRLTQIPAEAMPGAADLRNLPPTTIVLAEYDDLRPSGELLHRQLESNNAPVTSYLAHGMLHGHLNRLPGLDEVNTSLDVLVTALTNAKAQQRTGS
jgi:acetyl esterase/lipase